MKKRVAKWIAAGVLSISSILVYLFLFNTHLFSPLIISFINSQVLAPYDLTLSAKLNGSLLGATTGLSDVSIGFRQNSDTLFSAERIVFSEWESDIERLEFDISAAEVSNYRLNTQHLSNIRYPDKSGSPLITLIIQKLYANGGELQICVENTTHRMFLSSMNSKFWFIDGFTGIDLTSLELDAPSLGIDTVAVSGLFGIDNQGVKHVEDLHIYREKSNLLLDGKIEGDRVVTHIEGDNMTSDHFKDLKLPKILSDLSINFDIDATIQKGKSTLSGSGEFTLQDNLYPFKLINLVNSPGSQFIDIIIGSDLNNIHLYGNRDSEGQFSGTADIFRFHVDPFIPVKGLHLSEPIGHLTFYEKDDTYHFNSKFESFTMNEVRFDSLISEFAISPDKTISFSESRLTQNDNHLVFSGSITRDSLDLNGEVDVSDFTFLQRVAEQARLQGNITSGFTIKGTPKAPHIRGNLIPDNLGYNDKLRINGLAKYDLRYRDGYIEGNVALQGNEGILIGDSLEGYNLLANFSEDEYIIEDLHLQGRNNLISFSGHFGKQSADINKLNVILHNDQLKLIDSVHVVTDSAGNYLIPSTVIALNTAGIEAHGIYHPESGLDIKAQFELVDLNDITKHIKLNTPFVGIATGSALITGDLFNPIFTANLLLEDGNTLGYPSDSARIDITLSSHATISNRIDASMADGRLTLIGQLPWGYKMRGDSYKGAPQNFSITFENYRLQDAKLAKVVGIPVSGRATGSISIRGTPQKTKMDAQVSVVNATFDTLSIKSAYSDFVYEDNLWTFDSLSAISTWGYGSGTGSMPVSLDMVSDDRLSVLKRDMGLNFEFVINKMPFLTSYITDIDAIEGDFVGNLSFSGPVTAPIRNGKVRGHNGRVEVSVLGNPVTDIHAEATLVDNTLTIDHFSGRMLFSEGSALNIQGMVGRATSLIGDLIGIDATANYAGNVTATGTMDIHSFFEPIFDINVKATEVYYRSSDGLIEAIADADLQFSGQDTLDVFAVIPVKRAVYYDNFTEEESYQQAISQVDSTIFRYNLNTQFASDLLISNDQMEAEFEGELWLLDYGDGILRFTGTLTAIEGGKFYYLGNELRIVSGEIIFQSVDFNPQINMVGEIEIDGEMVNLALSGDLLEPELAITSESTQLSQTDILTYLTISQKLVEVSFDTESALNPMKTYSTMLIEKQLSKIGRQITGLDVLDIGINLDSVTTTAPRFQVGQRLSKNLKLTYEGSLQPTDGDSDTEFGLEYRINKNVSINSKVNQDSEVELNWRLKFTY